MIKKLWLILFTIIIALSFACVNPGGDDGKDKEEDEDKKTEQKKTGQDEVFTRPDLGNDGINEGKAYGWNAGNLGALTATITGNVTSAQYFYAQGLDSGWNAGNSLDGSPTETSWGNPALNQALFNGVKAQGFRVVRIPIRWADKIGSTPPYTVDSAYLDRVAEVVGYAHSAGLVAIIDSHHDDSGNPWNLSSAATNQSNYDTITARFTALWTQIATKFQSYGEWLIFEPLNEPRVGDSWNNAPNNNQQIYDILNQWNQAFVTAVRNTGGNNAHRYLMVKGYAAKPKRVIDKLVLPTDTSPSKLILDFHYYDPEGFCLTGNMFEWTVEDNGSRIRYDFEDVLIKFKDKGLPVIIGECGASYQGARTGVDATTANESRLAYHEYLARVARGNGFTPILWDNGSNSNKNSENSGLFNRTTGAPNSTISKAAIDAFIGGIRADK